MTSAIDDGFVRRWKDIASSFLKLGVMSYGGPAIMGIMQAELQEKAILLLAGGLGLFLFHSRKMGAMLLLVLTVALGILQFAFWSPSVPVPAAAQAARTGAGVIDLGVFFFKVGAFTFGGGLTMIAFISHTVRPRIRTAS